MQKKKKLVIMTKLKKLQQKLEWKLLTVLLLFTKTEPKTITNQFDSN